MEMLIIAGTVGKDAVLRRTQNDDAVLSFSVAVDQGRTRTAKNARPSGMTQAYGASAPKACKATSPKAPS